MKLQTYLGDVGLAPEDPRASTQSSISLGNLWRAIKRRKLYIFIPIVLLLTASVVIAFALPAKYRSEAIILVEQPAIPPDVLDTTVSSYAEERVQVITQRVTTKSNLTDIIARFNLYPQRRRFEPISEITNDMQDDIDVEFIHARAVRGETPTIAFVLGFEYYDPGKAKLVVNRLVDLYLSQNISVRQEKASETAAFLSKEAERLQDEIRNLEQKLAEIKHANACCLPSQLPYNLARVGSAEAELRQLNQRIDMVAERRAYLQAQLSQIEPGRVSSVLEERTDEMRAEYAALASRYQAEHPTLVHMRREIANLEEQLKAVAGSGANSSSNGNPTYVQMQAQIKAADLEIESLQKQQEAVRKALEVYRSHVERTPHAELALQGVTRAYEDVRKEYDEIKQKEVVAQWGETIEVEQKGERFSLLEPPVEPTAPEKPNRLAILLLGTMLALGSGIGCGVLAEMSDNTIRSTSQLAAITGAAPLAIIPPIVTKADRLRTKRRRMAIAALSVGILLVALIGVNVYVMPLDVLWAHLERYVAITAAGDR